MKLFRDKKGMEIAVSTVVGMILGALMLLAGLALLVNIMLKVDSSQEQLTDQMEQEIIRAFDSNDPIYIHRNPLTPGNKDKEVVFGIGIHNIYNKNRAFNITINHDLDFGAGFQLAYSTEPFMINSRQKEARLVTVPIKNLPPGQSSLTLRVYYKNETNHWLQHGTPRILYINK